MSGLPERIAAVRQKLWLSQPAFSARVGVTRNVVARWEGGKHGLRAGRLDRIAKLGGVSGAKAEEPLATAAKMYREMDMGFYLAQAEAVLGAGA